MLPTDPITRAQYLALAGIGASRLDVGVMRGLLVFWHGDPQRRNRTYVVFDAVLAAVVNLLVAEGLTRRGLSHVLPAMQMVLGRAIVADEAVPGSGLVAIGVGRDQVSLAVLAGTGDQIAADGGLPEAMFALRWVYPIQPALDVVRRRAQKHGIALPDTLAMPPDARPAWARSDPAWQYESTGTVSRWEGGRTDMPVSARAYAGGRVAQ